MGLITTTTLEAVVKIRRNGRRKTLETAPSDFYASIQQLGHVWNISTKLKLHGTPCTGGPGMQRGGLGECQHELQLRGGSPVQVGQV